MSGASGMRAGSRAGMSTADAGLLGMNHAQECCPDAQGLDTQAGPLIAPAYLWGCSQRRRPARAPCGPAARCRLQAGAAGRRTSNRGYRLGATSPAAGRSLAQSDGSAVRLLQLGISRTHR